MKLRFAMFIILFEDWCMDWLWGRYIDWVEFLGISCRSKALLWSSSSYWLISSSFWYLPRFQKLTR